MESGHPILTYLLKVITNCTNKYLFSIKLNDRCVEVYLFYIKYYPSQNKRKNEAERAIG